MSTWCSKWIRVGLKYSVTQISNTLFLNKTPNASGVENQTMLQSGFVFGVSVL